MGCCSMAVGAHNYAHKKHRLPCVVESLFVADAHETQENIRNPRVRKHTPDRWSDSEKTGHQMIEVGRRRKYPG